MVKTFLMMSWLVGLDRQMGALLFGKLGYQGKTFWTGIMFEYVLGPLKNMMVSPFIERSAQDKKNYVARHAR
jgi:hypothetical protein